MARGERPQRICTSCEAPLPDGKLQCVKCKSWSGLSDDEKDESITLDQVVSAEGDRIHTGFLDDVWGGGIVRTSVTLFGGLPGAGKSTILLQLLDAVYEHTKTEGIYVATEEVLAEIKLRADRLKIKNQRAIRMIPAMGGVANVGDILLKRKPGIIVLDSLQGLVGEDDGAAVDLLHNLKKWSATLLAPVIVISHVTKDGDYAGLMTYQHAVDTCFLMTPDDDDGLRTLFVRKNRFGRAHIEEEFDMTETGLVLVTETAEGDDTEYGDDEDEEANNAHIARMNAKAN